MKKRSALGQSGICSAGVQSNTSLLPLCLSHRRKISSAVHLDINAQSIFFSLFFSSKLNFPNFPLVDTSVRAEIQSVIQLRGPAAGPLLSKLRLLFLTYTPTPSSSFYIRRRKNSTQTQSANIKAKHEHAGSSSRLFFFSFSLFTPHGPADETKSHPEQPSIFSRRRTVLTFSTDVSI